MSETERSLLTPRLGLVPIGPGNAADLWLVHNDDAVVPWYDGWRPPAWCPLTADLPGHVVYTGGASRSCSAP